MKTDILQLGKFCASSLAIKKVSTLNTVRILDITLFLFSGLGIFWWFLIQNPIRNMLEKQS